MTRVQLQVDSGVATVTLDHPPLNIYDLEMRDELIEVLSAVRDMASTSDVGALVLRAAGRHFSAGADLGEFGSASSILEGRRIRWDRDPWGELLGLEVPTVVALHGIAYGSGMEMALLCDVRIADRTARLSLPETKLGMLPSAGGTQSLTRAIGPHAALPFVALADALDGEAARRCGIVHRVVDDADAAARQIAVDWSRLDPAVRSAAVRATRAATDLELTDGLAFERRLAATTARPRHSTPLHQHDDVATPDEPRRTSS